MKFQWIRRLILVAFFVSTLILVIGGKGFFNSPDEAANFYFTRSIIGEASEHTLIHPRSMKVLDGHLVPVSFLGFPLIAKSLLLTPILALLAVIAWRDIVLKIWHDEMLADLSAFFLMTMPAFWHYTARTMMHNVAFTAMLIFAMWFMTVRRYAAIAGVMLGLAIFIRTNELVWVLPLTVFGLWRIWPSKKELAAFIAGFGAVMILMLAMNNVVYGSPLTFGYNAESSAVVSSAPADDGAAPGAAPTAKQNPILPFGVHEMNIWRNVTAHTIGLMPWVVALTLLGALVVIIKRREAIMPGDDPEMAKRWQSYLAVTIVVTTWLFVVYGSWNIADTSAPVAGSIANSYERYWLPAFVLWTPLMALSISWALRRSPKSKVYMSIVALALIACVGFSTRVVFGGTDGLLAIQRALVSSDHKRSVIMGPEGITDRDPIIITDRDDKWLFPMYRVVVPLRSDATYAALPELKTLGPLYYLGITLPDVDLNYLNTVLLAPAELTAVPVLTLGEETLYRLTP